jgi:ClpP class serine protease
LSDFFWIFVALTVLQPVLKQRLLETMRARKIAEIESKRGSRVIAIVHRQETMRLLGFPLMRYIDMTDSEQVLRAIHLTDEGVPIDIILHTPGGVALAALQIARAVRERSSKVTVFVPHYAMSGGTLIALAADAIIMCSHSVLGPIDPQLEKYPAASVIKVPEQKPISEVDDATLILADIGRKATAQLRTAAASLLAQHMAQEQAEQIANQLTSGMWTHDYPITAGEAKAMGLPVGTDMPEAVLQLMALYPQPVRAQASGVEYLPRQRRKEVSGQPPGPW